MRRIPPVKNINLCYMSIKFAVIHITQAYIDVNRGQKQIKEDIEELLEDEDNMTFHTMESDKEFIEKINEHIKPSGGVVSGSQIFIGDKFYQAVFESVSNVTKISSSKLNKLGTQFTDGVETDKAVIVFKNRILADDHVEFESINMTDLMEILEDKFIKRGVFLKRDGTRSTYTYSQNHLDNLMYKYGEQYVLDNFQYDELELGDMVFVVSSNKNATEKNTVMTKIVGKDVNGDVYCSLYRKNDHTGAGSYISFNNEILDKIMFILQCKNFKSEDHHENITPENIEKKSTEQTGQKIVSPYATINRIYEKLKPLNT